MFGKLTKIMIIEESTILYRHPCERKKLKTCFCSVAMVHLNYA